MPFGLDHHIVVACWDRISTINRLAVVDTKLNWGRVSIEVATIHKAAIVENSHITPKH
jgi:hypothetical protein